jgi:hypothetical protein
MLSFTRFSGVIHIIHKPVQPRRQALPGIVDFIEKLTVYYMVGLTEKG